MRSTLKNLSLVMAIAFALSSPLVPTTFAATTPTITYQPSASPADVPNATRPGVLTLVDNQMTAGTTRNIQLHYNITSKVAHSTDLYPVYPKWKVVFTLPDGFTATTNDEVSIVGADKRKLRRQEISADGKTITLQNLDLEPDNGADVVLFLNAKVIPDPRPQGYVQSKARTSASELTPKKQP